MKMLKGELREIRYAWPNDNNNSMIELNDSAEISNQCDEDNNNEYKGSELQELSRSIMETNSVHYINGTKNSIKFLTFKYKEYFFNDILPNRYARITSS